MGLVMYGIDKVSDADRASVWRVLGPHLPKIADHTLDAYIEILPFLAEQIALTRSVRRDLIVSGTEALFLKPFDQAWLARVAERVEREAANGCDMRTRQATNTMILKSLNTLVSSGRPFVSRRSLRLIDVATRVLMHDASLGASLHYARQVQQSEAINSALTKALNAFDHVTKDIRGTVVASAETLRATSSGMREAYSMAAEQAARATVAVASTTHHVTAAADATESFSVAVEDLSRISASCARGAHDASTHMHAVNETIVTLSDAVERIGSVVHMIADVAKHTNLLALNAAIEAARAGEAGRGFAVVATEVKSLAAETSKATCKITELISTVQAVTSGAVLEIAEASQHVGAIAADSRRLADAVDAKAYIADAIARAASNTASDAAVTNEAVVHVTRSLDLTKDAAISMTHLSEDLDTQMRTLHGAIDELFDVVGEHGAFRPLPKIMSRKA